MVVLFEPGRSLLRVERARRKLLAVDVGDREKLMAASRKVDKLIVEYCRACLGCRSIKASEGDRPWGNP
jgi:hypothetical protein